MDLFIGAGKRCFKKNSYWSQNRQLGCGFTERM